MGHEKVFFEKIYNVDISFGIDFIVNSTTIEDNIGVIIIKKKKK